VSSSELGLADVVSVTEARFWLPESIRTTLRWIVSPGTMPDASTFSRFVDAPVDPRAIVTVPEETVCVTPAELVNVAKAPYPAPAAQSRRSARDRKSFCPRDSP
jgi:hypothetical protein